MIFRSAIGIFLTLFCVFMVTVSSSENGKKKKLKNLLIVSTEKTPDELLNDLKEDIKNVEEEKTDGEKVDSELEKLKEKIEKDVDKEELEEKEGEELEEEVKHVKEKTKQELEEEDELKRREEEELKEVEEGMKKHEEGTEESVESSKAQETEKNDSTVPASPGSKEDSEYESAPENSYAVWNSEGKICLLARLNATFEIEYPSNSGDQKAKVSLTHGKSKGKCESSSNSPLLQISWDKFVFTMMFNKSDEENWVVSSIEFTYNTSIDLFDGAINAGKKTARSKVVGLFETPLGKSYFCPAYEVVFLYLANKQVVTARLKDVHLQPYGIEDGKFSQFHRCTKVIIDGLEETPFVQDETVPLAVGCTLALITLSILIGFAVHRAYNAAKVDYNNME